MRTGRGSASLAGREAPRPLRLPRCVQPCCPPHASGTAGYQPPVAPRRLCAASPRRVYASLSSTVSHTPRCMKPRTAGRTCPSSRTSWPPGIPSGATDARAARIFLLIAGRRANDIPEFSGAPLPRSTIARRSPLPATLQLSDGRLLDSPGPLGRPPRGVVSPLRARPRRAAIHSCHRSLKQFSTAAP